jgi:hypothetical protein
MEMILEAKSGKENGLSFLENLFILMTPVEGVFV